MVGIHLDANYIFCKLMMNRTKGEMITAYQRMIDRMKLSALGLKHHHWTTSVWENSKNALQRMG
jgi:hypothetical protein